MTASPSPAGAQPMAGVRVLEVASHVFVPAAGAILAEWGAEVHKIEHPVTGDPYRGLAITGLHNVHQGVDLNFQYANRGKQSVGIDLKAAEGRALVGRLAAQSDVFLTNLRPAARERLGIDVDDLRADNPSIIYVSGSAQGERGPHADRSGYDIAAYWSRSGLSSLLASPEAAWPSFPPPAFGDLAGCLAVAAAVSAALFQRAMTGVASVIDVSLLGVGMWQVQPDIVAATLSGTSRSAHVRSQSWNPLVQHYRTRDDRFIALVMIDADRYWADFCAVIGAPELAADPRFVDLEARRDHAQACIERLDEIFARRDYDDWCEVLSPFPGAWSPVQRPDELQHDPQVQANGYLADTDLGGVAPVPMVAAPFQFDGQATAPLRAPEHGEHTESALLALGLDWDDLTDLKERGVIR